MNLTKLFNPAYLKENIKKSRGLILLFLILVPLFTALVMILEVNTKGSINVVDFNELSIINLFGMYVIPFVLSISLFGYVYKKNSVDFVNSMPLNRKTIFVTNTIGGILLITLMQFITALILVICDALLGNAVIFTKMISDIFILMWVSYVFVFVATNLAMTLSGTFLTQIALTLLILFLVPFCIDSFNEFSIRTDYNFVNGNSEFTKRVYENEISYTFPYRLISMLITGSNSAFYSTNCVIRMIVLGVLYFGIGIHLFQKRKMENTEESFSNIKIHIFVKALTMLPMIILLNFVDPDIEFVIFAVALISVYYFIFDFVVKRKVQLKVSILSLIAILLITQGVCMGADYINDKVPTKTLKREDVKAVSIGHCRSYSGGSWYYYKDMLTEMEYYFENQEVIELIFESGAYVEEMYSLPESEATSSAKEINVTVEEILPLAEVKTQSVVMDEYINYEPTVTITVFFKLKNGKKIESNIEILEADFDKMMDIFEKDEEFVKAVKDRFTNVGVTTIENLLLCDDETQEIINNEIKAQLDEMPMKEIYTTLRNTDNCAVYQYYYENHKLITNTVSVTITENVFNIATEFLNQKAVETVKQAIEDDVYTHFYVNIPPESIEKYKEIYKEIPETISGYIDFDEEVILNFILENANEKVDFSKEYYILRGNVNYGSVYFYTNKTEEILNMAIGEGIHEVVY